MGMSGGELEGPKALISFQTRRQQTGWKARSALISPSHDQKHTMLRIKLSIKSARTSMSVNAREIKSNSLGSV